MEAEEKDKLLAYTEKMIERGDRFADIILYLDRKGADSELKKEIISKLEEHKKMLESKADERKLYPVSMSKIVFGILFSVLTLYLWYMNIIAFPVTLLGIIVAIATLFEMTKSILNLFKNKR